MVGVVVLVVVFVLFVPVFLMSMGALAALLGALLKQDADDRFEGSELLDLNR